MTTKIESKETMEWRDVDWKNVQSYVSKLQTKIYQASKSGNVAKMRKLQHTLARSFRARLLAVRKVTQDNQGKRTAGVDGKASILPQHRLELAEKLRLDGKAKSVRRVQIPKSNGKIRNLGIPTIEDRAKQCLAKFVLEPEWEAKFSGSSYGFRPGRSCHDAIVDIHTIIKQSGHNRIILDADISKCFDEIDHDYLLEELRTFPGMKRQIKAWLKAGVQVGFGQKEYESSDKGTPQGGVISPLLANIALNKLDQWVESIQHNHAGKDKRDKWINIVRYADDFVLLINLRLYTDEPEITRHRIEVCKSAKMRQIKKVLGEIGLKISEEKTRWTDTFKGFDFLGFNVRQYKVGAYRSAKNTNGKLLGYKTLIKPSKKSILKHYHKLAEIIRTYQNAPKEALIAKLNPIIRGWCNYNAPQVSKETFSKLDHMVHLRLMRMLHRKHKCGTKEIIRKCFDKIGNRNWAYGHLLEHAKTPIVRHVKVKGEKSPFDGDWKYWANRSQKYSGLTNRQQYLFKKQKGRCNWCGAQFSVEDLNRIEIDHIKPKALGGTNDWKNLQLLHRHCHDSKTAQDLREIRKSKEQASWDNNPW